MSLFKHRPLLAFSCIWMATALLGFFLIPQAKLILLCLILPSAAALFALRLFKAHKRGGRACAALLLTLCLLIGAAAALTQSLWCIDRQEAIAARYQGQSCEVEATVKSYRGGGGNMSSYTLSLHSINGQACHYDALLVCYYVSDLRPGYTIRIQAEAVSLSEAAGDTYEAYQLLGDGIFGGFISMTESDCTISETRSANLSLRMARHRTELAEALEQRFGDEAEGLPSALFLGERGHIDDATRRDFARTGVSHLLAISGLHMTLLFGLLALLFKLIGIRPQIRAVILGLVAILYLFYLGFPPSATRAIIMLGMTYLSCLCSADADPLTSLGLAGMSILLFSPYSVADIGFWMSFSAAFGLLTIASLFTRSASAPKCPGKFGRGLCQKILLGLGAGVVAVTFSLWITAPIMGELSLLSAPMTLLLTPFVGALLLLIPLSILTASWPVAPLLTTAIQKLCSLITHICAQSAKPSWVVISLRHEAIPIIALLMVCVTLLLLSLRLKKKGILLVPMIAGWMLIAAVTGLHHHFSADNMNVSYLIPSSTSEMLVMTRGQTGVICEFSNGSRRSFLTAAEEAAKQGATELAAVILTDYHSRTSGALLQLCQREMVRALWMPRPSSEEDYYLMLSCLEVASQTGTSVVLYEPEDELVLFETATMTLQRTELQRSVQPVLLMALKTPTQTLLFCGSSIMESSLEISAQHAITHSSTVIFSNKGPLLKHPFQCSFGSQTTAVYLADPSVAAHLSPDSYPDSSVAVTVGQGRFVMALSPSSP